MLIDRLGENSEYITEGEHADTYAGKLGKTSYAGLQVSTGKIWTARGKHLVLFSNLSKLMRLLVSLV
jgi:hypothetical protein